MKLSIRHRLLIKKILNFVGIQIVCFFILYVYKLSVAIFYISEDYGIHICIIIQYVFWICSLKYYLKWEKIVSYTILAIGLLSILAISDSGIYKIPTIVNINNPLPLLIHDIDIIITLNIYLFLMSIIIYYTTVSIKNKIK